MNRLIAPLVAFSLMTAKSQAASEIRITPNDSQPSIRGAAETFTGTVRVDGLFKGELPARIGGGTVTFEPGARTAWHTHPLGQPRTRCGPERQRSSGNSRTALRLRRFPAEP